MRTIDSLFDYEKACQDVTNLNRLHQANSLRPLKKETVLTEAACTRMGASESDGYWVQLFAENRDKTSVLSRSTAHIDEVTVLVTIVSDGKSKVVRKKKVGRTTML